MTTVLRIWFCLAVATIAAAIADPLVESAANAGWFGPGQFTDRSTWDVLPALAVGGVFVLLHYYRRLRTILGAPPVSPKAVPSIPAFETWMPRLLPVTFCIQLGVLYGMEMLEQRVVYGHIIGGNLWLGGPVLFSLTAHAVACVLVAALAAVGLQAFTNATFRLVKVVQAFASLQPRGRAPLFATRLGLFSALRPVRVLCNLAERAPPPPFF